MTQLTLRFESVFTRGLALLAILLLLLLASNAAATVVEAPPARVAPGLAEQLVQQGETTFWVVLKEQADLSPAFRIPDWEARGRFVFDRLVAVANSTQPGLRALLQQRNADFKPFWILNAIRVTGDQALLEELARQPEVDKILPDQTYHIPEPLPGTGEFGVNAVEWNIDRINAPQVWSTFGVRGEGIVVANIDTGVQFNHPALVGQYRGNLGGTFDHNYNWFDPSNICGSPSLAPCDNNQHGTHTMGTMVGEDEDGTNQIGVAPGARWIAAKGCESNTCSLSALLASGQWVLAPTDLSGQNPRPDLRPHVVNNSWGGPGGDTFYQATVDAWVAAGIFPAFSNGNSGPNCDTSGSPGDYVDTYSAGAFDINNTIAGFSSRGPSAFGGGELKPNIAAPGVNVRSSVLNNAYGVLSGTSMASPHVAGTVVLMWSVAPALVGDVSQTRALLDQTAVDTSDLSCGGTAADNNVWGEGRLDAFEAVDQSPHGPTGTLAGAVTDATTGAAINGATVTLAGPVNRTVTTDPAGQYSIRLPVGSYAVTARAFGYFEQTASGVVINENQTTIQDFALTPMPRGILQGTVTDASDGGPIPGATVEAVGSTGMLTVLTDGSGQYSFPDLPVGSYDATARASGYFEQTASGVVINENQTTVQDFALATTGLWTTTGSMTGARSNHTATRLNDGRVLVTGGNFNSPPEVYDPATRAWAATGSLTDARNSHTATLLGDGRVLVAGGHVSGLDPDPFLRLSSAEIFDPATGTWAATGSLTGARSNHTATRLNDGRVLVAGGFCCTPSDGSELSSAEIFDPATGTWAPTGSMTDVRRDHIAILLGDGRVLVAGGVVGTSTLSSAELFDPATGTWAPTGSRTLTGGGHAWLLNDGRVLVINAGRAELYDPATGAWTATGDPSPTPPTSGWSAAMLDNGLVLVAGGFGGFDPFGNPTSLRSAELFDLATGRWTPTRDMSVGRRDHAATLLADGQVLVAGGISGASLSSAELFDLRPDILEGTVTDANTGAPIPDATIEVTGPFDVTGLTGADGFYSFLLRAGTFDVAARAFGYAEQTANGVVINQDQTTVQDFALATVPAHPVSGHVLDTSGAPIANATVTILDTPLPPATTDANGFYSFASVPEGTYAAQAPGPVRCFAPQEQTLTVAGGPATLDFTLEQRSDSFGYTCRLVAPAYIEATNVIQQGPRALPFPFPFYGETHTLAFVSQDGYLFFSGSGSTLDNSAVPSATAPNDAIYPFWDNMFWGCSCLEPQPSLRTELLGTAPDRRFVIEWRNVRTVRFPGNGLTTWINVEVVLFENGQILFQYSHIDPTVPVQQGSQATVGIENQDGTVAFQYSFNEALLSDATAILFQAGGGPPPPPTPTPTPTATPTPTSTPAPTATPTPTPSPPPAGSITVIAPNGGEVWPVGSTQTIQWTSQGVTGNVRLLLSRNGGASYKQIANNVPNTGAFQWTVTRPATTQALIRVISIDQPTVQDTSDSVFSITQ
ncbi:MAG: carboxypeptidase regulatory-like domain-containing protein [Chloroflexi bacterium]|nr:carboxypeptidase regulatory-like domain-containing protein [Chloroflexota bacterium]